VNGTRRIRASSGPPAAICHTFVVAVFAAVPDPSVPAAPGKYAPRATLGWRPSRRPAKDILPAFESNKKDEAAFIAIAALLVAFPRRGFLTRGLTTLIRVYWSFHNFTYNSGNGKHRVTASGSWKPPGTSFSSIKRHYLPTALSLSLSLGTGPFPSAIRESAFLYRRINFNYPLLPACVHFLYRRINFNYPLLPACVHFKLCHEAIIFEI
jgi:hypothetical protein